MVGGWVGEQSSLSAGEGGKGVVGGWVSNLPSQQVKEVRVWWVGG